MVVRDPHLDLGEIGRKLNAYFLVTGRIHECGDKLRLTTELIETETWQNVYRHTDDVTLSFDDQDISSRAEKSGLSEVDGTGEHAQAAFLCGANCGTIQKRKEPPDMSETQLSLLPPLVERSCGECNVCCYALTIDEPALAKPQGVRCQHSMPDFSCAIYGSRPDTCRKFWCGWRLFRWVRETLRPDQSGVLIRARYQVSATEGGRAGVVFSLLTPRSLDAEGLLESIAAAVAGGLIVHLHIPGPPGYTSSTARVDEALADVVTRRGRAGMMATLSEALKEGQAGPRRKIVLKHAPKEKDNEPTIH